MRHAAAVAVLSLLAACGADGDPIAPERDSTDRPFNIEISGEVGMGISSRR
ncbi:hypothetical protein GCM10011415_31890 [Salipiger pallidus]|uniref:Uncharacterized protein n=1 Tax=Salipiger pallidus TaxID=1775170 RepID=A0A8J2ZLX8_9RHOB|nr:argininosuccinate lyase [Salipiger pallidus]GGG80157.1 hypothetical protein GCM10011415_31890 [Salipiger pallidus]